MAEALADFEEYRIIRPLGRGAMGQVYLAHDQLLDRPVAVKVLATTTPTQESRERFLIEARALARLQHPNVVTVYRVGELNGRPYLVSEFLRGHSLNTVEKPMQWRRVLEVGVELARALAAAHRQGVLHRDIKPANAWLTEEGTAKLLDFGLAKILTTRETIDSSPQPLDVVASHLIAKQSSALTVAGAILGSPLYMPPEAWRGEPATRRGDVFSLGVLLHELCAGTAPLALIATRDIPACSQQFDAPPLGSLVAGIDPAFAAVVERCLQRDPTRRFESANQLREVLEALLSARAVTEVFEGNPYRGLMTFEAEHRGVFFGRDAEVRMVIDRLRSERCVVITADSGIGKSSLCRAGIIPALQVGAMGLPKTVALLMPGRAPLTSLAVVLSPLLEVPEEDLRRRLGDEPHALGRLLRQKFRHGVVLFVDQLEELVTVAAAAEAQLFAAALTTLVEEAPGIQLLASVRSDFFARVASVGSLSELTSRGLFVLQPLAPEALRSAIVGPAIARGVHFEADEMVDSLTRSADGALPLLQFVLNQLWETRAPNSNVLTRHALKQIGGLEGCLARHGDALLQALPSSQRDAAKDVLLQLVTAQGERAGKTDDELMASDDSRKAVNALIAGRLIVVRASCADAQATYELAHEALIRHWGTLRDWLNGSTERRLRLSRLERAAAEWVRLHRAHDSLWGDQQLDEIRGISIDARPQAERDFVDASRRELSRRTKIRWATRVGLPVLAVVSLMPFLKWRYDRSHTVSLFRDEAQTLTLRADQVAAASRAARLNVVEQLDASDPTQREAKWAAAREMAQEAESTFAHARNVVEQMLLLAPTDAAAVRLQRTITTARVQLADSFHEFDRAKALAGNSAELTAPGRVTITGLTPDARWHLEPVATFGFRVGATRRQARDGRGEWSSEDLLGAGSWLLTVERDGFMTSRVPFVVQPAESVVAQVAFMSRVPDGFCFVPPGRFFAGSADDDGLRRFFLKAQPLHERTTEGYLIGQYEVTYAQWLEFLAEQSPSRQAALMPHTPDRFNGVSLRRVDGRWQLTLEPSDQKYVAFAGETIRYPGRTRDKAQDWLHFPVTAVSFDDARAYAEWLSKTARVPNARLCTDLEWEHAARGADARRYPHGDVVAVDDFNHDVTYGRVPSAFGPDEVGSHPQSRSLFGVDDLSGNVWEMVIGANGHPVLRGGSWYQGSLSAQIANREESEANNRDPLVGFRVCADPPLEREERGQP